MAEQSDMDAHVATYTSVMTLLKWSTIVCFLIGAAVVWLIAS